MKYPKFENELRKIARESVREHSAMPGYGIIMEYDPHYNRASVLMASHGSDEVGELLTNVPCPVTMGVQTVSPQIGRPCWVEFKDNSLAYPVITHYFNHIYEQKDYLKQSTARNPIPRFMLGM